MTTPNARPVMSLKMLAAAPASPHDSEAPSDFDGTLPPSQASLLLPSSGSQTESESDYDLVLSAPLDSDAMPMSAFPPLAGPSSLKMPTSDANNASGSKRKQEDADSTSQSEENSTERKRPKRESLDDWGAPSFRAPGHMSDVAGLDSTVNEPGRSGTLSLDDESNHSKFDSSESASPLPDAPSSLQTVPIDLPPRLTPPPRPHSAPPTSPILVDAMTKAPPLPPSSSLPPEPEPLHTYSCPICFSSPTNATLTPCGHIMCGECLFTAVGAATVRMGIAALAARCPVCRAAIPRWDGRGGGVTGLQPRVVITI